MNNYMFLVVRKDTSTAVKPWVDVIDFICIESSPERAAMWHPTGVLMDVDENGDFCCEFGGMPIGWVKSLKELNIIKLSENPVVDEMTDHGRRIRMVKGPMSGNYRV